MGHLETGGVQAGFRIFGLAHQNKLFSSPAGRECWCRVGGQSSFVLPFWVPLLLLCQLLVEVLPSFWVVLASYLLWEDWLVLSLVQT